MTCACKTVRCCGALLFLLCAVSSPVAVAAPDAVMLTVSDHHVQAAWDQEDLSLQVTTPEGFAYTAASLNSAVIALRPPQSASTTVLDLHVTAATPAAAAAAVRVYLRQDFRAGILGDRPVLLGELVAGQAPLRVRRGPVSWWRGVRAAAALGARPIPQTPEVLLLLLLILLPQRGRRQDRGAGIEGQLQGVLRIGLALGLGGALPLLGVALGAAPMPPALLALLTPVAVLLACVHQTPRQAAALAVLAGLLGGAAGAAVFAGLGLAGTSAALGLAGSGLGLEAALLGVLALALPGVLLLGSLPHAGWLRAGGIAVGLLAAGGWLAEVLLGGPPLLLLVLEEAICGWPLAAGLVGVLGGLGALWGRQPADTPTPLHL